jgi:hypothetical protein
MNCRMRVWILRRDIDGPLTVLVGCDISWPMLGEELALFLALMDMPCISWFYVRVLHFCFPSHMLRYRGKQRVTSYLAVMGEEKCALHNWISKETKYELVFDYAFRSALVYICSFFLWLVFYASYIILCGKCVMMHVRFSICDTLKPSPMFFYLLAPLSL